MLTIADVKNYLSITWEDPETNKKVEGAARRAAFSVGGLIGVPKAKFYGDDAAADSEVGGEAEQLFLDAVRYIYNDAFEDFRKNFSESITSLRAANAVAGGADDAEKSNIIQ